MYAYTYAGHKYVQFMHTRVLFECQGRCTSEIGPAYVTHIILNSLSLKKKTRPNTHIPKYVEMLYANIRNLGQFLKKSKKYTNEMW